MGECIYKIDGWSIFCFQFTWFYSHSGNYHICSLLLYFVYKYIYMCIIMSFSIICEKWFYVCSFIWIWIVFISNSSKQVYSFNGDKNKSDIVCSDLHVQYNAVTPLRTIQIKQTGVPTSLNYYNIFG